MELEHLGFQRVPADLVELLSLLHPGNLPPHLLGIHHHQRIHSHSHHMHRQLDG